MSYDAWCESFVVGEPVRSWLSPRFKVRGDELRIRFTSVNSDLPHWAARLYPFQATFVVTLPTNCPDERNFHLIMRGAIHELLQHEADEAIRVRGEKSFDPHYASSQTLQACGGGGIQNSLCIVACGGSGGATP